MSKSDKNYTVNEVFYSMQGEGVRAGTMNVFLRFTGCNLQCSEEAGPKSPGGFDCDTEFTSGRRMSAAQVIDFCDETMVAGGFKESKHGNQKSVIFTGGEPALQLDPSLVQAFKDRGYYTCIETNGSKDVSGLGLDWITVSPKVAEHAVRQMEADEVKYVRGYGQALPNPTCKADHQLISPAFDGVTLRVDGIDQDQRSLEWCVGLIREDPRWRLSVQLHKV